MKFVTKVYTGCLIAAVVAQIGMIVGTVIGIPDGSVLVVDIFILTPMNIWTIWFTQREIRKDWHRKPKRRKNIGPRQEWLP